MFVEIGSEYKESFKSFHPFPLDWSQTGDVTQKNYLLNKADEILSLPIPDITLDDFSEFSRTGNRVHYEEKYFKRRKNLGTLVLAEKIQQNSNYTDKIIAYIYTICAESTWCLPAHNTYIRDEPQHEYPDVSKPVLDLFACETGAALSTVLFLLGDSLDRVSPHIRNTVSDALKHRIITPYLRDHFWWMGRDDEPMNNWTIWCTQNILITFFLTELSEQEKYSAFQKALKSIDHFMDAYGDDGCCDEGAQYYRHAALCLHRSIALLNTITEGHFLPLYKNEKIRNMASYIHKVHVHDDYYINFSDCLPKAGRAGVREYLFAKDCDLPQLMAFASADTKKDSLESLSDSSSLFDRTIVYLNRKTLLDQSPETECAGDVYFDSVGLFISRSSTFVVAVKAGDNDDSHNHNDTGSITVYKNGTPFLIDVGVESYTKKTFSKERYTIWTMQSQYHNLMTFNDTLQKEGSEYCAENIHYHLGGEESKIMMSLHKAYPQTAGVQHYKRVVTHKKTGPEYIDLVDEFIFEKNSGETFLSLMCAEPPQITDSSIQIGNLGIIETDGAASISMEVIEINDQRLLSAWDSPIYRIKIYPEKNHLKIKIQ